jgi:hypothetical protein
MGKGMGIGIAIRGVRVQLNSYPARTRNFSPVPGLAGTGTGTEIGTRTRTLSLKCLS